jgi:hypothetical protein
MKLSEAALKGVPVTITVSASMIDAAVYNLREYFSFETTAADLIASKEFLKWLQSDVENMVANTFDEGLADGLEGMDLRKIKGRHVE